MLIPGRAPSALIMNKLPALKDELDRASFAVATGQGSDTAKKVGGDLRRLVSINLQERQLSSNLNYASRELVTLESQRLVLQNSLSMVEDFLYSYNSLSGLGENFSDGIASTALQSVRAIFAGLNTEIADRSIFGGVSTLVQPLQNFDSFIEEMLAQGVLGNNSEVNFLAINDFISTSLPIFTLPVALEQSNLLEVRNLVQSNFNASGAADDGAINLMLSGLLKFYASINPELILDPADRERLRNDGLSELTLSVGKTIRAIEVIGGAESRLELSLENTRDRLSILERARSELLSEDQAEQFSLLQSRMLQVESLFLVT